jgi:hypothetical protein
MAKVNRRIGFIPGVSGIDWINPSMVGRGKELGFRCEDNFEFKIINNDFAGTSSIELANLYVSSLKEGV